MLESILTAGEQVAGVCQFRQHNQIRPVFGGLLRQLQAVLQIGLAVLCTHLWVELHNGNTYGTDSWVHR